MGSLSNIALSLNSGVMPASPRWNNNADKLKELSVSIMLTLQADKKLSLEELSNIKNKLEVLSFQKTTPRGLLDPSIRALSEKISYLTFLKEMNESFKLDATYEELERFIDTLPSKEAERYKKSIRAGFGSGRTQLERRFALHKLLEKYGKELEWLKGEVSPKNYEKLLEGNTPFALQSDGNLWIGDQTIAFIPPKDLLTFSS